MCGLRLDDTLQSITDPDGRLFQDDVYLCFEGWPFCAAEPVTRTREQWALDVRITASGAGFVCIMLAASEMYLGTVIVGLTIAALGTALWSSGRTRARERAADPHGARAALRQAPGRPSR